MKMTRFRTKLALFNLLSKVIFSAIFIAIMPFVVTRVIALQTDFELMEKREQVLGQIESIGIEPFIATDTGGTFGSYDILKDEFISIEKALPGDEENYIDISSRLIEGETIEYRVLNYSFTIGEDNYLLQIGKSTEAIRSAEKSSRKVMFVFLLFFILVTLAVDLIYTKRLLRPLEQIIQKLRDTSSPGLFNRVPVQTTTSDFVSLDRTLTELMEKIEGLFRKEKEITVNISHELLTPVSIIRMKLESLLLREETDVVTAGKIEEALNTLSRLSALVNSMLMISRIESRQYLKNDTFTLDEMLDEVIGEISPVAENKGTTIAHESECNMVLTSVNRSLIFAMFFNIVNNAVKNTGEEGRITVKSCRNNGRMMVKITDNGRGMSVEQKQRLFSRFVSKPMSEEEGTGIGLAITKSIADFHNIIIEVDSAPGAGSTFSFIIP